LKLLETATAALSLAVAASGCGDARPSLVQATIDVPAPVTSAPFLVRRSLLVPRGWQAEVWARVDDARFAAWTPTGELLVSSPATGEVLRLIPGPDRAVPPLNNDLLAGLDEPQGLAFVGGSLWVAEARRLVRFSWPSLRVTRVVRLPGVGLRGLTVGPSGTLYVAGAGVVVSVASKPARVAVANAEGVAIAPDGRAWLSVNSRGGGADRIEPVAGTPRLLPAHSVPLGLSFLERSRLPQRWRGGVVVALHGAASGATLPQVAWLPWHAGRLGAPVTLVGGFSRRWGRPVDALAGPDGSLYVTDDRAGAVYRLTPPR
jgi:glucose/arabinose dehydrogenase